MRKQILKSLRANKLKKQETNKNLPSPHRRTPFLQTVMHTQARGAHRTWTADSK